MILSHRLRRLGFRVAVARSASASPALFLGRDDSFSSSSPVLHRSSSGFVWLLLLVLRSTIDSRFDPLSQWLDWLKTAVIFPEVMIRLRLGLLWRLLSWSFTDLSPPLAELRRGSSGGGEDSLLTRVLRIVRRLYTWWTDVALLLRRFLFLSFGPKKFV